MNRRWLYRTGLPASGMAITILYFFPIYWMYVSSLKSPRELFADPPTFFPHQLWLDAYETIIARGTIPTYIANSFFLAGTSTLVTMVLAVATSYGMSRIRSRWVEVALILVMLSQVLPPAQDIAKSQIELLEQAIERSFDYRKTGARQNRRHAPQ